MNADDAAQSLSSLQRYLILAAVVLGSSLYSTALLTTSTILPQMQGALSATQDEIAWAMTFNILATAVVTPMTGWLVARFGAKRVMTSGILCFSIATFLCGLAQSLDALVLWRIIQGATGAPVVPLSQTILLNTFPRRQHPVVLSLFGMAVGVAPVVGPVLGGYLAEAYTWRWAFHMLVPVGMLAYLGLRLVLPADTRPRPIELDWTGFLALAAGMAALQLVLARGVRLDWFDSTEILLECVLAAIAFYVFIVHCLTTKAPFLNLYLLCDRNYAVGLVLVTIYGMLNFTPMVLLPPLLQQYAGFPDALVGEVVGCRGLGMTVGFLASALTSRLDPRIGMSAGFLMQVVSGAWMLTFDLNVTMEILVLNSLVQGFAVGLIWVPLSVVAFDTLAADDRAEASAVFHLLRNLGSSFFISLSIAEIVRATGANYSRMVEMISPYNTTLALPWAAGGWDWASVPGLARIAKEITRQAAMIGYLNGFMMYTVASGLGFLFVLVVRRRRNALARVKSTVS
ncbi:MAG TPA: DHA2 family efflux MFS transporter permease subunit [Hyphomicrobiaceae bacterium]